jgi:hypothetical protein
MYSKKNITGCVLAVGGTAALIAAGIVAPPLAPVALLIIPSLYGAGALLAPSDKKEQVQFANALSKVEADNVEGSLTAIRENLRGNVGPAVEQRVTAIIGLINELLPRAHRLGKTSVEMHTLVSTATDYLPNSLNPYLAMPRYYAEHRTIQDGKTSEDILCEQLDVLYNGLQGILDAIAANDAQAILANGQFLNDKFGTSSITLNVAK